LYGAKELYNYGSCGRTALYCAFEREKALFFKHDFCQ